MSQNNTEKRHSKRRQILDYFSFYACIPKIGYSRLKIDNISETGIGFNIDTFGEIQIHKDDQCDLQFYVNQSLFLPLKIQVMRHYEQDGIQKIGAVFLNTDSSEYKTYLTLVKLVDQLVEFGEIRTDS